MTRANQNTSIDNQSQDHNIKNSIAMDVKYVVAGSRRHTIPGA